MLDHELVPYPTPFLALRRHRVDSDPPPPASPSDGRAGGRASDGATGRSPTGGPTSVLSRSRSANSLKQMTADPDTEENKLTVLSQLFWLSVCLLESDYEYEYLLAMRLLEKVGTAALVTESSSWVGCVK